MIYALKFQEKLRYFDQLVISKSIIIHYFDPSLYICCIWNKVNVETVKIKCLKCVTLSRIASHAPSSYNRHRSSMSSDLRAGSIASRADARRETQPRADHTSFH